MSQCPIGRFLEFDALKRLATLVVFLYHCLQPFHPKYNWHITNLERAVSVDYISAFINMWCVQLFMLLAGVAAYFTLKKKSILQFVKDRILRIFIPFVFGMLLFAPIQIYWQRMFEGHFFGSFFEFYPKFFHGTYPYGNFSFFHLWFLAYVFVYSLVGLVVFRILQAPKVAKKISLLAEFCEQHPALILTPALLHIILHISLFWIYPLRYPVTGDIGWHAQLFSLFLLGYMLVSENGFLKAVHRVWELALVCSVIVVLWFFIYRDLILGVYLAPSSWIAFAIEGALFRMATWCLLMMLLGLGHRFFKTESRLGRYFSEASYPFYILHQFIIVGLAFVIVKTGLPVAVKAFSICIFSFTATILLYEMLRRIPILSFLIGIKPQKNSYLLDSKKNQPYHRDS